MNDFKNRLRNLREEKKLTRKDMSKLIDISHDQLYNWETGRGEPDVESLGRICALLRVKPEYFLGDIPERPATPEDLKGEIIHIPPDVAQRVLDALSRMDPARAEEITQRIESAAELFPKEKQDAPAKKMA